MAIAPLKLTMPTSLYYIALLFGVGKVTTQEAVFEVCSAVQDMLANTMFQLADPLEVVVGFQALDRTCIPITCPPLGGLPLLQLAGLPLSHVAGHDGPLGAFTNNYTSWTGSTHNAQIFQNSTLPALEETSCFAPGVSDLQLGEVIIPLCLIRDHTYPLLLWLICPHNDHSDPCQAHFSQSPGHSYTLVECAFGHLKGCWHTLTGHLKFSEDNISHVITTAYMLYSICKAHGELFCGAWVEEA
ncbi:hypothetical protein Y1Q_0014181 [Alligator mississippiensis]|uniref:DDE Tnp4 domain-containing protein n=1 Tax=Alligator mississippiensis TaxID=8496 RepID=A0A151MU19_ALLMI|nr:hypothetical protein Y1Q_0014181 [Alligator mississippiensis]